jgi:hypothetical protein
MVKLLFFPIGGLGTKLHQVVDAAWGMAGSVRAGAYRFLSHQVPRITRVMRIDTFGARRAHGAARGKSFNGNERRSPGHNAGREGRDFPDEREAPALPVREPYGDVPLGVEAAWPGALPTA